MPVIRLLRILNDMLFPSKCTGCGAFFHPPVDSVQSDDSSGEVHKRDVMKIEKVMAPFLCQECISDFVPVESPVCSACGMVFESRTGYDHLCGNCIENPKRFGKARAVGLYDKTLMDVIHSFKYKGKIQLARPLEELLFNVFVRNWDIDDIDIVLPVPLHLKRFRQRGFNQAYLLVRDWPEIAGNYNAEIKRSAVNLTVERNILFRVVSTQPQTGLGRKERKENIRGAFSVADKSKVEGKKVLLVDDVYTTGATVEECAKAILERGAAGVDVLTLARAA